MKYCQKCQMQIENNIPKCPLCGDSLIGTNDIFVDEYPPTHSLHKYRIAIKIIWFAALLASGALLIVNFMTSLQWLWILAGICSMWYLAVSAVFAIRSARNIGLMVLVQTMGISLLTFVIDFSFSFRRWSLNYVIPLLLSFSVLLLTVLILCKPLMLRDFIVYLFVIAALGLTPVLLLAFGLATVSWPSVVVGFLSAAVFVGMFFFASRKTKHEMKKRFHV